MIKSTDEVLVHAAIATVQLRATQKAIIEVLIKSGHTTAEEFKLSADTIFESIKEEELKHLLELTDDEFKELSK